MTKKGQAVSNPRISAGATNVNELAPRLRIWFCRDFRRERRTANYAYLTIRNHINAWISRRYLVELTAGAVGLIRC